MKKLNTQQMEVINAQGRFSHFCAGFAAGQAGIVAAVKIGLITAPPIGTTAAAIIAAIDVACAVDYLWG